MAGRATAAAAAARGGAFVAVEPTLHIHCSFVHVFRQHVEVAGGDRTLTMSDFVISDPSDACRLVVERDRGLADLDTVVCRDATAYAFPGAVQEANMFRTFAKVAASGYDAATLHPQPFAEPQTPELTPRRYWEVVSLRTQCILDAVMESAAAGGAEVLVVNKRQME